MPQTDVYVGMGSNLSAPVEQLNQALLQLAQINQTSLLRCSSFYISQPMGPQNQPDYVNAVAHLCTSLSPMALLRELQNIELVRGRVRKADRWGARVLDLDILLFGEQMIDVPELVVPHYGMKEREFVLYPLFELSPQLVLPCGNSLESVLARIPLNGLAKIETDSQSN